MTFQPGSGMRPRWGRYVWLFIALMIAAVVLRAIGLGILATIFTLVGAMLVANGIDAIVKRRRPGEPPVEEQILAAAGHLHSQGVTEFHGSQVAEEVQRLYNSESMLSSDQLYNTLIRLEVSGAVTGRWELFPPDGQPRRKMYRLTQAEAAEQGEPEDGGQQ